MLCQRHPILGFLLRRQHWAAYTTLFTIKMPSHDDFSRQLFTGTINAHSFQYTGPALFSVCTGAGRVLTHTVEKFKVLYYVTAKRFLIIFITMWVAWKWIILYTHTPIIYQVFFCRMRQQMLSHNFCWAGNGVNFWGGMENDLIQVVVPSEQCRFEDNLPMK